MNLKRIGSFGMAFLLFLGVAGAIELDDIATHRKCGTCGMDRKSYGYSRALVRYADGAEVGTCSLNCAVVELGRHPERQPGELMVADRDSLRLIEAPKAFWVMGGKKRGVMTGRPKWAFAERAGADAFVSKHGGAVVEWGSILKAAQEDARLRN